MGSKGRQFAIAPWEYAERTRRFGIEKRRTEENGGTGEDK
jgi:hypothetical protein